MPTLTPGIWRLHAGRSAEHTSWRLSTSKMVTTFFFFSFLFHPTYIVSDLLISERCKQKNQLIKTQVWITAFFFPRILHLKHANPYSSTINGIPKEFKGDWGYRMEISMGNRLLFIPLTFNAHESSFPFWWGSISRDAAFITQGGLPLRD